MTTAEKMELSLVPLLGGVAWLTAPWLPGQITVGTGLLWAAALVLLQGLGRDVWLLAGARRTARGGAARAARCMCVESTVGVAGIVVGTALLGTGSDRALGLNRWGWGLAVAVAVGVGFALKDYVFKWSPFRLHRDKDHLNIVFTWKK